MRGKRINDERLREMGEIAASECDPTDDNRGSAEYKRELVKVLVPRAAERSIERLG